MAVGGCESKSIELRGGDTWRFMGNRLDVNSSAVDVPPFAREVAVEIWLAQDGSSGLIPALSWTAKSTRHTRQGA